MQSYSDSEIKRISSFDAICKKQKRRQYKKLKCLIKTGHLPELQLKRFFDAIKLNDVQKVATLLNEGLDPNAKELQCRSALHIACSKGYCDIVSLLLEFGADPNIRDIIENTPLHLAACTSNLQVIEILIDNGADIKVFDKHGKTPLQLAESKLQIMKHNWKNGAVEMKPIRTQMQQIVDIMIALWKRKEYQPLIEERNDLQGLELMKLSLNDDTNDCKVDDQFNKLLADLQHFTIK